jgi:uncharacterized protein (DUF2147 family)
MIFVFLSPDSKLIPMKKLLFLVLFMASAILGQAQVSKMLGQWNTFDDKTGDMRSCVNITEKNGTYYCEVIMLYEKDANGKYKVMQPPYAKEYEGVVGTQLFIDMKQDDDVLRGEVYDPESQKTYYGKVSYKAKTDELILRGSLDRAGWLGRSQTWKRKK